MILEQPKLKLKIKIIKIKRGYLKWKKHPYSKLNSDILKMKSSETKSKIVSKM